MGLPTETSLERAYRMFVRCHHVVAAAADEPALYTGFCQAAVHELGYRLAWIGLTEPGTTRVSPVAHAGFEDGYLESIVVTAADDDHGRGPTGTAIRERRSIVARDLASDPHFAPWRAHALARGYASSAAIPLLDGPRALGALNLYAREADAFDEREVALLEEAALDLALGILRFRTQGTAAQLEAHLSEAARLETANVVATAVAHDLANLLQVVSLSLRVLDGQVPAGLPANALRDAQSATGSAVELAMQILALARRTTPGTETSDLDAVLGTLRPLLLRVVRFRSSVDLVLGADHARVPLSRPELERIVINLALNAAQAAERHVVVRIATAMVEIDASAASPDVPAGRYVELRVRDDGPGIPRSVLPRLFEPFVTTKEDGTGLGLASVAHLVRKAGGNVRVESHEGEGTEFAILLPRVDRA